MNSACRATHRKTMPPMLIIWTGGIASLLSGEVAIPERPAIVLICILLNTTTITKTLLRVRPSKIQTLIMLALYRELAAVKNLPDFSINGDYTGWDFGTNADVHHFQISGGGVTYKIYVNCGSTTVNISPGTVVLDWNATSTQLQPYGIVISKV